MVPAAEQPVPGAGAGERVPLRELMDDRLLDALLERSRDEAGGLRLTGEGSMLGELVAAVLERALAAELTAHLGYQPGERSGRGPGSQLKLAERAASPDGADRGGAGAAAGVAGPGRHVRVRCWCPSGPGGSPAAGCMVISLYAHGMSVRDIIHHLEQVYGTQLSHETVSRIDRSGAGGGPGLAVPAAGPGLGGGVPGRDHRPGPGQPGGAEQARLPGGRDRRRRGEAHAGDLAAKTAPETATAGEGARFWGSVMADLRNRGVRDILIACCDGLAGFEDAITGAFPLTVVQRCVVHLIPQRPAARRPPRRRQGRAGTARHLHRAERRGRLRRPGHVSGIAVGKKYPQAARVGSRPGTPSPRSWPSARPSAGCSAPPTRSRSLNYQLHKVTKARGHCQHDATPSERTP